MKVSDAFGKVLKEGDDIAWIANPSRWNKKMVRGILMEIDYGYSSWPRLKVRPLEARSKTRYLTTCRFFDDSYSYFFERVIKL